MEYLGYDVTRLLTLTNIEDKALAQAEKEGLSVEEVTSRNEAIFFKEFEILHIRQPDYTVRASAIVDQAVKLIMDLLNKGIAYKYCYKGALNVYYDPLKFSGFGKLAHLDISDWPKKKRRFHKDTYPGMPWNKGDFVLWHGCKGDQTVCWDTPIGRGRPAWNIQDAAMVTKHLGFSVDIACGGIDNLVRHHDYTLAIVEAVSDKPFARYWLHGGHLYVAGQKMSKSKGNVLYLEDLLSQGYSSQHIRFFLTYGAYQEKLNFTWKNMAQTSQKLDQLKAMIAELQKAQSSNSDPQAKALVDGIPLIFKQHMDNNLDVKAAFDALYGIVSTLFLLSKKGKLSRVDADAAVACLRRVDSVLQVLF